MPRLIQQGLAAVTIAACLPASPAFAHCFVGARFFPATMNIDDPCVASELSLPTVASFRNGDDPAAREIDISGEFSVRLTDTVGISIGSTWVRLRPPGGPTATGFENLESSFKYQFLTDPAHEFVMSASLDVEWGHTGSAAVDADPFTTLTPTLFMGRGFGDLPDSVRWLRPFAVTAQVGYSMPTQSSTTGIDPDSGDLVTTRNPRSIVYGGSLQYSMPYLKSSVVDLQLPEFVNHLIPVVEWSVQTQVSNFDGEARTTGTINPGVLWVGNYYQLGVEAIIPINRASGDGVGAIAQLHFYLDDIFPTTIGRPLLGTSAQTSGRPSFGN
jgi:hypothetical protein